MIFKKNIVMMLLSATSRIVLVLATAENKDLFAPKKEEIISDSQVSPAQACTSTSGAYEISNTNDVSPNISYFPLDLSGSGTLLLSADDALFTSVALGNGSPFPFYLGTQAQVQVSTNGWLGFDIMNPNNDNSNECLPSSSASHVNIAAFWDDLVGSNGNRPNTGVYHQYFATCPHPHSSGGCDIFQWYDNEHFSLSDPFNVEAILFGNGDIVVQISEEEPEDAQGVTIGIQDKNGQLADVFSHNEQVSGDIAILFSLDLADDDGDGVPDIVDDCPGSVIETMRITNGFYHYDGSAFVTNSEPPNSSSSSSKSSTSTSETTTTKSSKCSKSSKSSKSNKLRSASSSCGEGMMTMPSSITMAQTRGCSCGQIMDRLNNTLPFPRDDYGCDSFAIDGCPEYLLLLWSRAGPM